MPSEASVLAEVKLALGALPDLTIWRCNTGAGLMDGGRWVEFGTPGQADVQGVLTVAALAVVDGKVVGLSPVAIGRFFTIETKATHRPTCQCKSCKLQRAWGAMVVRRGGVYGIARTKEQALEIYQKARRWEI